MEQLTNFLTNLRGDVFKLLPMKESEINGANNHINEYIDTLIINLTGAMVTYPILSSQKQYLYVVNNIQYLGCHSVSFQTWRKIILNSTKNIDNLCLMYGGRSDGR